MKTLQELGNYGINLDAYGVPTVSVQEVLDWAIAAKRDFFLSLLHRCSNHLQLTTDFDPISFRAFTEDFTTVIRPHTVLPPLEGEVEYTVSVGGGRKWKCTTTIKWVPYDNTAYGALSHHTDIIDQSLPIIPQTAVKQELRVTRYQLTELPLGEAYSNALRNRPIIEALPE